MKLKKIRATYSPRACSNKQEATLGKSFVFDYAFTINEVAYYTSSDVKFYSSDIVSIKDLKNIEEVKNN